jgi:hypothetical protein
MPGLNNSQAFQTPASSLRTFWSHPRFLRAIPSLMVLTTAIAWGTSSHAGELALDGALRSATGVSMAAGVNADVRLGANSNVTAEQRMSAMGAVGGANAAQMQGAGSVDGAAAGADRTAGAVRDRGEAVGSAAARTGQRATQGAKAEASGGLKGSANAMPHGASMDSHMGAGAKGALTTR